MLLPEDLKKMSIEQIENIFNEYLKTCYCEDEKTILTPIDKDYIIRELIRRIKQFFIDIGHDEPYLRK